MNPPRPADAILGDNARDFLRRADWHTATVELLTGDASTRKYYRLRKGRAAAILVDASPVPAMFAPFIQMDRHLQQLGFSVPAILAQDESRYLLLLEDFGDDLFSRVLDREGRTEELFTLATDVLIALHRNPQAIPAGLRTYHPEAMLADVELFLEWRTPGISESGRAEFRRAWREVLPRAHEAPATLLLRDYHVANLMWLPDREGIRRAGLLDFQDAYQGPATYDLMSLLEDARRDLPEGLKEKLLARYRASFPALDRNAFATSWAVLAALRHTRILAIFERLSRREGKPDYKKFHTTRVERQLHDALGHPALAGVKQWMERYVR